MQFDPTSAQEKKLVELLAKAKREPKYEANFEANFLRDFQVKQTQESVKQSTMMGFTERLQQALNGFSGWNWIYGSMAVITLCAVIAIVNNTPEEGTDNLVNSSSTSTEQMAAPQLVSVSNESVQEDSVVEETTPFVDEKEKEKSERSN